MPTKTNTPRKTSNSRNTRRKIGTWLRRLLLLAACLLIAAGIGYGLWPKPLPVETATIERGPLTVSVLEEGKTRIRHRYVVSPPVAGYLHRVDHRAGARIEAGETVLAVVEAEPAGFLDPRARAQAEARLRAAEAVVLQRHSEIERIEEELDHAQREFERTDELFERGAVSRERWDAADNRLRVLQRQMHTAEFAVRVAEFEKAQAEAALSQLAFPSAEESEPLRIMAPVDGYVLNVYEENARSISPGTPIMEVGDPQDLEAEIELLSSDAVGVSPGAEVTIERWGGPDPLRGVVTLVERGGFTKVSALGVEEQRVIVRVDFVDKPPPDFELGDRFRVEARIVTWHGDDVLKVPTGALFRRGMDWMVFVVEEGEAHLRTVEIGRNSGTEAEVLSGLSEGDRVIVYPPDEVSDRSRVTASEGNEEREERPEPGRE